MGQGSFQNFDWANADGHVISTINRMKMGYAMFLEVHINCDAKEL